MGLYMLILILVSFSSAKWVRDHSLLCIWWLSLALWRKVFMKETYLIVWACCSKNVFSLPEMGQKHLERIEQPSSALHQCQVLFLSLTFSSVLWKRYSRNIKDLQRSSKYCWKLEKLLYYRSRNVVLVLSSTRLMLFVVWNVYRKEMFNCCPSTQTRDPLHAHNTTETKNHFENTIC